MSVDPQKKRNQTKLARLEIVGELHKKGYSLRMIRVEVMKRLDLATYSLRTVHNDIQSLLAEWREYRLSNTDDLVLLELERIDDLIRELYTQWEKSKADYTKTSSKSKGAPVKPIKGKESAPPTIAMFLQEKSKTEVIRLGDVSYITEIGRQLVERRKLLGLYAPELREVKNHTEFDLSGLTAEQKNLLQQIGETALNDTK